MLVDLASTIDTSGACVLKLSLASALLVLSRFWGAEGIHERAAAPIMPLWELCVALTALLLTCSSEPAPLGSIVCVAGQGLRDGALEQVAGSLLHTRTFKEETADPEMLCYLCFNWPSTEGGMQAVFVGLLTLKNLQM